MLALHALMRQVKAKQSATAAGRKNSRNIGERLSRLRKERGLSQGELGERIGVVQRVVSHYERNELRIPAETLLKMADVLKVSLYEFFGRAPSSRVPKNRRLWRVLEKLESLPPRDQKFILRNIELMSRDADGRG